jgi:hypothetical protein
LASCTPHSARREPNPKERGDVNQRAARNLEQVGQVGDELTGGRTDKR